MDGHPLNLPPRGVETGSSLHGARMRGAMRVVATTGMPGSGKSLAIDVAEELDIGVVSMGDLVREEVDRRGLEAKPESFGQVASGVREDEGAGAWAERTVERVRELEPETVLVDGMRSLDELEVFREAFDDVLAVAILASPDTRYERMRKRGRGEDADDEATLAARDRRELDHGLGDAIAMADVFVDNEGHPDETRATLRAVLGAGGPA